MLACVVLAQEGLAQAAPAGVFSEIQAAVVPRASAALEPATVRSRIVQLDTQKVTAARRGRELLKLNLFDDAVVEVRIRRLRATRAGHFISGTPVGKEWGEVRLVVNGPVMVGTAITPEGKFTIRSAGSGRHVIRQIDPAKERFECEVEHGPPPLPQPSSLPAISSTEPPGTGLLLPRRQEEDTPTEDGSEIRVLMLYTAAKQAEQGGPAGMTALIDLFIESANEAFELGGIHPRLVLAHAAMVDYVAEVTTTDLYYLRHRNDGHMDEIHELRNKYAADLVHLITNSTRSRSGQLGAAGTAGRLDEETTSEESTAAFAVTAAGGEHTFTHEIGHNFGLRHDRYVESPAGAIYPYAFGYVNNRAFEPDAPESSRWQTIMAYANRCGNAGFACTGLFRFSNPDQTYMGDPLGVPADSMIEGAGGPADARLTINKTARWVGSFRSEACTEFSVASETLIGPVGGGEVIVQVESAPGCIWQATSEGDFLQITSGRHYAGNDLITIDVEPNPGGSERTATISIAGADVELRQLATTEGVCGRTSVVMGALTQASGLSSAAQCAEVSDDDLAGIETLDLSQQTIGFLQAGDFEGLSGLQRLDLGDNRLSALPEGLFRGLSSLEELELQENQLTELRGPTFAGLASLRILYLHKNQLAVLGEDVFSGLSNLEEIGLSTNRLTDVPEGLFNGLTNLQRLSLTSNDLAELPERLFAGLRNLKEVGLAHNPFFEVPQSLLKGLSNLEDLSMDYTNLTRLPPGFFADLNKIYRLNLRHNALSSLPEGIFAGLSQLRQLYLDGNDVHPLPVSVSVEKTSDGQVKAIAPLGAPFEVVIPIIVGSGGEVEGGATSFTIPTGAVESTPLKINRAPDAQGAIHVELGAPPGIPAKGHLGYVITKEESTSLRVLPSIDPSDTALIELSVTDAELDPAFSSHTQDYRTIVENEISSVTVMTETSNPNATVALLGANDEPLVDAVASKPGHQIDVAVGEITLKVEVSSVDGTKQIYTIVVTRDNPLNACARKEAIRQAVLAEIEGISDCGDITEAHLASITILNLFRKEMSSLNSIDLSGMTALEYLDLRGNLLSELPADVFSGLTRLRRLALSSNLLTSLPAGIFSGLSRLEIVNLRSNRLHALPSDLFSGLTTLNEVWLHGNELVSLPEDIFAGLPELQALHLGWNRFRDLPTGLFARLPKLQELSLQQNLLTDLPPGIFSKLTEIRVLGLSYNRLEDLPDNIFSGLSNLQRLDLRNNAVSPLPLPVSLEKVGDGQFKAIMPTGAPFAVEVPVRASNNGVLDGDTGTVAIFLGAVESDAVGVKRIGNTEGAVSVDIGVLPPVPEDHRGYFLDKGMSLPLIVLSGPKASRPERVSEVAVTPGSEQLLVIWLAVSDAGGYKVEWKSGDEDYDETRQAVIIGGDTTTHTITGLTAGAGYTVRVIATKQNAEDGPPSAEITGVPGAEPPAQVTGVAVAVGVDSLDVSWDAVSDADGYKVEWKSGGEAYDESRQAVVAGGDSVRHTIADLTPGTAYTVRVTATREHADDGAPSEEVTGIPKAQPPAQVTGVAVAPGHEELQVSWDAVSDADGYKVQWKSGGEDYAEERQVALLGGETTRYTIIDLTLGTEYTIRVIATKEHADDGAPSEEVTATPARADPDVNADGTLDGDDAQVMYQAYASAERVGDGESGGTAALRRTLLSGLAGTDDPTDDDLKAMLRKANVWRSVGLSFGGDINEDGAIDGDDAFVMYYAYEFADLVGDGETGGTARHRQFLLSPRAGKDDPSDADLKKMLRRANQLKEDFG